MKKRLAVLLILLIFLTGCSSKTDINTLDRAPFEAKAEEVAKLFLTGEAEKLYPDFTSTLAQQLPEGTLVSQSRQFSTQNSYVQTLEITSQVIDKYIAVDVLSEISSANINTRVSYTAEGKIAGLFFTTKPLTPALLPGEEEIKVGEHALAGRLMLPDSDKAPVVILIAGSGSHGMDEIIGKAGNAALRDISLGLQEKGIATIRYDKRFYSDQTLAAQNKNLTIQDEVLDDVDWVIQNIESFKGIDTSQLYVLGHSLGGMVAPDIAARHPEVKGIISLAGSPRKLENIMEEQLLAQIEKAEMSEEEKESQREILSNELAAIRKADTKSAPFGVPFSYWESLNEIYAPKVIGQVKQPILILQGSEDVQVFVDRDFAAWKDLLKNRDHVTFKLYEGLNHLFMKKMHDDPMEDYNTPNHVDKQVIEDMAEWIKNN